MHALRRLGHVTSQGHATRGVSWVASIYPLVHDFELLRSNRCARFDASLDTDGDGSVSIAELVLPELQAWEEVCAEDPTFPPSFWQYFLYVTTRSAHSLSIGVALKNYIRIIHKC